MSDAIPTTEIKQAARELGEHVEFLLSPTALHFAATPPADAVTPRPDSWTCMFALMRQVQAGKPSSFSAETPGCVGASCYLGFNGLPVAPAAFYLSKMEKLKKDVSLAAAFYKAVEPVPAREANLIFRRLDTVPDDTEVEVVNLWISTPSLSALHTLANYDRAANDNAIMPFSSGCQSIWTLPYKEKTRELPKVVVGSLDPTVRVYLPAEAVSFSAPANRFLEMCRNIEGSFLAP